ncbi:MAG TPA: class I SAM-dependent methyltransferase, partial [Solirubrobacteraceae bacterium]|nr:class I SAM-dependent methyltransferase [Solirubrobacteraceae bacterium]
MRRRLVPTRAAGVAALGAAIAVALLLRSGVAEGSAPARAVAGLRDPTARRARLQKGISKLVYGMMSRAGADPATAFINYGYAALDSGEDATSADDPDRFGSALYERVAGGAPLRGRDVLEVGCGRGGGAAVLFERHRPRSFVGMDLASSAIERCRRDHARPGLEFVQGDAEALPFPDASFDV